MLTYLSPIHKASRQIGLWFEERIQPLGISPQEGHLLSYLRSYAPCPITELVRVFGLKPSTLTSILDRLERAGLITREVNPDDRRSFVVSLSRKGHRLAAGVQKLVVELEGAIDELVTPNELNGFRAVMGAIGEVTQVEVRRKGHE